MRSVLSNGYEHPGPAALHLPTADPQDLRCLIPADPLRHRPQHYVLLQWATPKKLEAAIWTDLPPKFNDRNGVVPTVDRVIAFLEDLVANARQAEAENYIRRAPSQIATA